MRGVQWNSDDVTIVMAGSPPAPPVQSSLTPCPSPKGRGELAAPAPVPQQSFPPLTTQAANLFQSVVAFVGDGCGIVDDAQYRERLEICRTCDRLSGNRCLACGCFIYVKARGRIFRCPIGHWQ